MEKPDNTLADMGKELAAGTVSTPKRKSRESRLKEILRDEKARQDRFGSRKFADDYVPTKVRAGVAI